MPSLQEGQEKAIYFADSSLFPCRARGLEGVHSVYFSKVFNNCYFVFPRRSQVPRSELMWILGTHPVLSSNHLIALLRELTQLTFHMAESLPYGVFPLLTSEGKLSNFLWLTQKLPRRDSGVRRWGEASRRNLQHVPQMHGTNSASVGLGFSFLKLIARYKVNHPSIWAVLQSGLELGIKQNDLISFYCSIWTV